MKTVLALGAHFDDVEIGAAGTLIRHISRGDIVYIVILCSDEFKTGSPSERLLEQFDSLDLLGIPRKFLITMHSKDDDCDVISKLDEIKPDIIYTSYWNDTHQDHRRCSMIGQSVGRKPCITTLFYGSGSAISFNPNVFISIDFDNKVRALNCHKSQKNYGAINIDRIKKRENYWSTLISDKGGYAEGFIIHKMEIVI